jgi:hypothetical protein
MRLNTPSGSINKFLGTNQKTGATYPRIPNNLDRDPNNVTHWRWNFTYKLPKPDGGGFITKSVSVPHSLLPQVQAAITDGASVQSILSLIRSSRKPKAQKSTTRG